MGNIGHGAGTAGTPARDSGIDRQYDKYNERWQAIIQSLSSEAIITVHSALCKQHMVYGR